MGPEQLLVQNQLFFITEAGPSPRPWQCAHASGGLPPWLRGEALFLAWCGRRAPLPLALWVALCPTPVVSSHTRATRRPADAGGEALEASGVFLRAAFSPALPHPVDSSHLVLLRRPAAPHLGKPPGLSPDARPGPWPGRTLKVVGGAAVLQFPSQEELLQTGTCAFPATVPCLLTVLAIGFGWFPLSPRIWQQGPSPFQPGVFLRQGRPALSPSWQRQTKLKVPEEKVSSKVLKRPV